MTKHFNHTHCEKNQHCDHPGCTEAGEFKAPKDRSLKSSYWFCLKHVQEYNKNWNYYAGFTPEQIERELDEVLVGHRPTWRVNDLYSARLKDPFNLFGFDTNPRRTAEQKANPLLSTPAHLEAIKTLALCPPISCEKVKKNYKEMAKKYHPDKTGGNKEAEEIFKQITSAYHLLIKAMKG